MPSRLPSGVAPHLRVRALVVVDGLPKPARGVSAMPNEPNGPIESGGPQAYRPASPDVPDIPLADVDVPTGPKPERTSNDPSKQVVSNPDGTSPFGPDAPNTREDKPIAARGGPEARPHQPPAQPLEEDQ